MKRELQQKLFNRFPGIFRDRDKSPKETSMCWGVACGDGWFHLIWSLCEDLENVKPDVVAFQVKQKLGGLCFYIVGVGAKKEVRGYIDRAEANSFEICEWCGCQGSPKGSKNWWIKTLCPRCRKKESIGWKPWTNANFTWFRVRRFIRKLLALKEELN